MFFLFYGQKEEKRAADVVFLAPDQVTQCTPPDLDAYVQYIRNISAYLTSHKKSGNESIIK